MTSAAEALDSAPGCIVVVGEPKAGVTRIATEVMRMAGERGARLIWAESGSADPEGRLAAALGAAGLSTDAAAAASACSFGAYLGHCSAESQGRFARALGGTAGVVVCEASAPSLVAPSLRVAPLTIDDSAALVELCVGLVDECHREQIVTRADGLPGCLVLLARGGRDARLEDELVELVRRRVAKAGDLSAEVLFWAARLGRFDVEALVSVTGEARQEVESQITALVKGRVLEPEDLVDGEFFFVHELTRWAIAGGHGSCGSSVAKITEGVEATLLRERQRLMQSAKDAVRPSVVLAYADAALADWRPAFDPRVQVDLHVARGLALESMWDLEAAIEAFERGHDGLVALGDMERATQVGHLLEGVRSRRLHQTPTVDITSLRMGRDGLTSREATAAQAEAALVAMRMLRHEQAVALGEAVLAQPRSAMSAETRMKARLACDLCWAYLRPTRESIAQLERLRHDALGAGLWLVAATAANAQTTLLGDLYADYDRAAEVARTTIAGLGRDAPSAAAPTINAILSFVLVETGDVHRAEALAAGYASVGSEAAAHGQVWLGRLRGEPETVVGACPAQDSPEQQSPDTLIADAVNLLLVGVGEGRLSSAHEPVALAALAVSEDDAGAGPWKLLLYVGAVEADIAPGRLRWREELERLDRWGAPAVSAYCRYADCFFVESADEAVESFRAASERFAEIGLGWWAARARLMAGLAGAGDDTADDLRVARAAFDSMGAMGWRERVEDELRARGHRWAAGPLAGGVLSAREVEVVRELAAGRSNAEIAVRLVLSENTVARHLTRIYRKLGAAGRAEAVRASADLLRGGAGG